MLPDCDKESLPLLPPGAEERPRPALAQRLAGILQPVFAIRTGEDLGIGDTEGVRQMIAWCHRHGFQVLQMLPIQETGGDHCPYNAISAMAIDPVALAISPRHIPDLPQEKFDQIARPDLLAKLRAGPVNYFRVKALKHSLLECAFEQFTARHLDHETERAGQFGQFMREHSSWIYDYALFRALMWENGDDPAWERWPAEHQSPERARIWLLALPQKRRAEMRRRELLFIYGQWLAFGQWQALRAFAAAKNVLLMGDMPIGIGRGSADVWAGRAIFDLDWSGGAPPETVFRSDPFTEKWGQNWGAPLYRWEEMRRRDFAWWRARAGLARQIFHLCRLDHVMGLFRIYAFPWTPDRNAQFLPLDEEQAAARTGGRLPGFRPFADDTPEHAAANQRQGEEILRVILEAAGDMTILAEDLGVVPDYVRATLEKLGVPGFRVPALFREADGRYCDPAQYPRLSLVQPSTHDHPPLAAAWAARWGAMDRGENVEENLRELRHAMDFAGLNGEPERPYSDALHQATLRAALRSNSMLAVVMLADVFAQTARFNTPGAASPENWSARMSETVDELDQDPNLLAKTQTFSRLLRETGRGA
jgi:4-alpha-glucanotransferase